MIYAEAQANKDANLISLLIKLKLEGRITTRQLASHYQEKVMSRWELRNRKYLPPTSPSI